MNNESSEGNYGFDPEWLDSYKPDMKFPGLKANVGAPTSVDDIHNPLAPVTDWYIKTVLRTEFPHLNGFKVQGYFVDDAFEEADLLRKTRARPQDKSMENIMKLQRYFRELDYAAKCMEQKGVPCDSWPLDAVLVVCEDARENIEKIANVMPIN